MEVSEIVEAVLIQLYDSINKGPILSVCCLVDCCKCLWFSWDLAASKNLLLRHAACLCNVSEYCEAAENVADQLFNGH